MSAMQTCLAEGAGRELRHGVRGVLEWGHQAGLATGEPGSLKECGSLLAALLGGDP